MPSRPSTRLRTAVLRAALPLLAVAVPFAAPAVAQELSVESIFASTDLSPEGLPSFEWSPDGTRFTWIEEAADGVTHLVAEVVTSGARERLVDGSRLVPPGERKPVPIEGYAWSPESDRLLIYTRSQRVWRANTKGVYFVYDLGDGTLRPLSTAFGWQQFAKFSPDGRRVGFVRENDLWVVDLATGAERRLTHDGSEDVINGTFDWVYEEELGLRDGWRWSPDSRRIAFWRLDQSAIPSFFMIDDLTLYAEPVPVRYPKAGEANSVARIGVVELSDGSTTWVDTGANPDVYLARMEWAASSDALVVQRLNRHQDRLDVLLADAGTGATRLLFTEESDTWLDVDDHLTWTPGGRRFVWSSERDGYLHLYLYGRDGTLVRRLTSGDWDVDALQGVAAGYAWFTAAVETPLGRQLYRVPLDGGAPERLTEGAGWHAVDLGPDARHWVDTWSRAGRPAIITVRDRDGDPVRTLVDNEALAGRLDELGLRPPDFFTFTTSDGVRLNGWRILPPDFDGSRRWPVLMYVYGGPGSQTVVDRWGGTRYLWHQLLAQEGWVVVSVDNRGTGARGRDFKNVTYLDLGRWETHDQIEAARWLASRDWVDPSRIGIWGWSYGGYMTLLSMMQGGDLFAAGISVAPVTSWKFYDTIYTERYMRTPRENPEGYRRSAPLENVAGLTGELLLVHGTGDDNVHFQNSVQLVDRLVEAGKQFDLMIYPNRTHSISGRTSRTHLYTLMMDFLRDELPAGPSGRSATDGNDG